MDKEVTLKLPSNMVGQILDGLRERTKVWRETEQYMEVGYTNEPCIIEECSNADEARNIAEYYEEIIGAIEKQLEMAKKKSASL
ncbi:MAG: hypothetical protein WC454_02920 [Phycisphaerae bacterium]|jgi:hypothetical protein